MTWKREYGKPTQDLSNPNQVFADTRTKTKTKKARWEDRNAIDLPEVRAKLKKIQKES